MHSSKRVAALIQKCLKSPKLNAASYIRAAPAIQKSISHATGSRRKTTRSSSAAGACRMHTPMLHHTVHIRQPPGGLHTLRSHAHAASQYSHPSTLSVEPSHVAVVPLCQLHSRLAAVAVASAAIGRCRRHLRVPLVREVLPLQVARPVHCARSRTSHHEHPTGRSARVTGQPALGAAAF